MTVDHATSLLWMSLFSNTAGLYKSGWCHKANLIASSILRFGFAKVQIYERTAQIYFASASEFPDHNDSIELN